MKFLLLLASQLSALFSTLDPDSVSQALAFYELYPECEEGRAAACRVQNLLGLHSSGQVPFLPPLVNRLPGSGETLSEQEITFIEDLGKHLANRKLDGYRVRSEAEVLTLPPDEIDLGLALVLSQLDDPLQARSYSARLDLMALQILARLPQEATAEEKIAETNRLIFDEMHIRFPPQSLYAEKIDHYTFLPSVMDNHLGVCLGVTALYLAIAQRIDLPLEIVTPPGHIFVRTPTGINIETTARGINPPHEIYLNVNTRSLPRRDKKEVVGMTHFNQASVYMHAGEFEKAARAYEKARLYMPGDPLVKELLGYSYLMTDQTERGEALLREIKDHLPDEAVAKRRLTEDYLAGHVDREGIRVVFQRVDETRTSILAKKEQIEALLSRYPKFRDGYHQLAVCWIQLNRGREALEALNRYHALDPNDPTIEYYLAVLNGERHDLLKCWEHLKQAEALTAARDFSPRSLKSLRRTLTRYCPEPPPQAIAG